LTIPAKDRAPELVASVVKELGRVQATLNQPRAAESAENAWSYYGDLLSIASASPDPVVIDALIQAVDVGQPVVGALAKFGNAAAPKLIAKVMSRNDAGFLISGIWALYLLVEKTPGLASSSRKQIMAICLERLTGRQHSAVVRRAIGLAKTLKDPALIPPLSRIAGAQTIAEAGITFLDQPDLLPIRRDAEVALKQLRSVRR
jgi:hypothetical protein